DAETEKISGIMPRLLHEVETCLIVWMTNGEPDTTRVVSPVREGVHAKTAGYLPVWRGGAYLMNPAAYPKT
ncbi:MAG: hypothetical protein LBU67_02810, partial [Oscillospiraceae bacterium]|nr:hypothetical protein [Oscillospiraceae bacterium]